MGKKKKHRKTPSDARRKECRQAGAGGLAESGDKVESNPQLSSSGLWKVEPVSSEPVENNDEVKKTTSESVQPPLQPPQQNTEVSQKLELIGDSGDICPPGTEEPQLNTFKTSSKPNRKRSYREAHRDCDNETDSNGNKPEFKEKKVKEQQPFLVAPSPRTFDHLEYQHRKYSVFEIPDRKEVIVVMRHPREMALWGYAACQVVWGHVSVLGYTMTHTSLEKWPIYSPSCNSFIKVSTVLEMSDCSRDLCKNAVEQYVGSALSGDQLQRLLAEIGNKSTVISLSKLDEKHTQFICSISPFETLFPDATKPDTRRQDDALFRRVGVSVVSEDGRDGAVIATDSPDVKRVRQELLTLLEAGENPVVVLCGGKNVGKSTLARHLINTALNHRKEVAYLECDVGQTEFTPPACVALNIVRQPVFGVPFAHQRRPERCCFFGAVSPADDPGRYLRCVRYVHDAYRALPQKPTLVVNTMGWNKGLGLTFMADTLRMVSPSVVIQINSRSEGRNFPPLHSQFVHNTPSWWHNQESGFSNTNSVDYRHKLITMESPMDYRHRLAGRFEPLDHRNLALLANLGHVFDHVDVPADAPFPALQSVTPYKVPWSAVAVHVCHAPVPNSQILNVLNGSVVALCHVPEGDIVNTEDESLPKFLRQSPICGHLGFGVIRSIDPEAKCFYVITGVCVTDLARVNCLLKGALDLPRQILFNQPEDADGDVPYVGEPLDVVGASAIPRRRHMQRRRPADTT